eukprot:m.357671 g.357671  ORF g.357671 m.357671 type:complete len:1216 (-) comp17897_c0_seq1:1469-5116(-)
MRAIAVWDDKLHDKERSNQSVYAIAFNPDGTQLAAGAGNRVVIYEAADGEVIKRLRGHKGTVYCVAYSPNGLHFASGGADNTVIVWNCATHTGLLKYTHNDPIQSLSFNPVNNSLISCSTTDFGFWNQQVKNVDKIKCSSRICSTSWTNDGQYVALGLFNGNISIRNMKGTEKVLIQRPNSPPIWSIQWNPSKTDKTDVLAVCDWNQTMSFYLLSGRQVGKDRKLNYDPCSISFFSEGDYFVAGGSNKTAALYTREGVHLQDIGTHEGWIWSCAVRPGQNYVAVGCDDGTVALYQLVFSTVHGLYLDRYAIRRGMTNVVVQDLTTGREAKVPCKQLVKKLAIYKDRLAMQLPNQVNVYEMKTGEDGKQKFRMLAKIRKAFQCNLLVVCTNHVIICFDKRIQSYTFGGQKEREWSFDSSIRYIKVTGGPSGHEGLLLGQANGAIYKVFVDNAFPIELIKQATPVRCLDISASRQKLAVVDGSNTCFVYDIKTKRLLFQEPHANSIAWNSQNEDMLCFGGNGQLHIKAGDFPLHKQKQQGFVVGFSGSKIYSLHIVNMTAIDVPQSHTMQQYLKKGMYDEAYAVACLGVTEADWRTLAMGALEGLNFQVAKQAFIRVRDTRYLDFIAQLEARKENGIIDEPDYQRAMLYATQGAYDEAAKLYSRCGHQRKAMEMFVDLRQFDRAKTFLDTSNAEDTKFLMQKQTEWCKTANDPTLAIDILNAAGQEIASINLMGENGMVQKLIDKARATNSAETEVLDRIVFWLQKLDQVALAAEVCEKMGDEKRLIGIFVAAQKWDEAFALCNRFNGHHEEIYRPYADWLVENDRFEEAQEAYAKAGLEDRAVEVLQVLAHNAVVENRFEDAGYYFWQLAQANLEALRASQQDMTVSTQSPDVLLQHYQQFKERADIYHAYHAINRYIEEPFTSHSQDDLLTIANYLLNALKSSVPYGVSTFNVLFAAAKLGKNLAAFKLARSAFQQLQTMKIPSSFREHVNVGSVLIRCKPLDDAEDLMPVCFRCTTPNNLWSGATECSNCKHPFVLSRYSYEVLPLVEFVPDSDISDAEAQQLIQDDTQLGSKGAKWGSGSGSGADVMTMEDEEQPQDSFLTLLEQFEGGADTYTPLRVDRDVLRSMPSHEVFVEQWPDPLQVKYYRNVMPETAVTSCTRCKSFFASDDWDHVTLKKLACPYCRMSVQSGDDEDGADSGRGTIVAGAAVHSSSA